MKNESIVATGIYYFQSENITLDVSSDGSTDADQSPEDCVPTQLGFRVNVCEPDYEQGDEAGTRNVFMLENEGELTQSRGFIETIEGRCIAFPNTLQHRVAPFRLKDSTKEGKRRILVFFLVDPTQRVLSTSVVPPQQQDWLVQELADDQKQLPPAFTRTGDEHDLGPKIVSYMPGPMSLEEACATRDELMLERKYFVRLQNDKLFERPFSLCEH
jgi:Protein of unknown function (DUF4246)